jgi:uncharacterized phage protein (TIGR01671 family)
MREIKFRAWDKHKKQMLPSFYFSEMCFKGIWDLFPLLENFNPDYIMQYTGLKDKTGKELYEGDVVQQGFVGEKIWTQDKAKTHTIISTPKGAVFYSAPYWNVRTDVVGIVDGETKVLYLSEYDGLHDFDNVEVIGNIYENPELLKEQP